MHWLKESGIYTLHVGPTVIAKIEQVGDRFAVTAASMGQADEGGYFHGKTYDTVENAKGDCEDILLAAKE